MSTPNYSLTQLRHFLDAAASGSFTTAARKNFVSRPAVSKSLTQLEAELGYALFEHRQGRAVLTPAGRRLAESLEPAFAELQAVLQQRSQRNQGLKLGVSYSIFRSLLQRPLARLLEENTEAAVELSFGSGPALLAKLLAAELDVIVAVDPEKLATLQRLPLWRGDFVLARKRGSHSPTLFTTEDRPEVLRLLETHGARRRVRLGSWSACLDLALEGAGSAFVPDFLTKGWSRELRTEPTGQRYGVDALWRKESRPSLLWDALASRLTL